jgi:hypothetical protein
MYVLTKRWSLMMEGNAYVSFFTIENWLKIIIIIIIIGDFTVSEGHGYPLVIIIILMSS